jgi:hypothetical protein
VTKVGTSAAFAFNLPKVSPGNKSSKQLSGNYKITCLDGDGILQTTADISISNSVA